MSATAWDVETIRRFRAILSLVSTAQVRTAYEIAERLALPTSSTYEFVADMERLSCLARDESGFLMVGVKPRQIALDALGYCIPAQQLPPLVRHLRDQTGATAFVADLGDILTVGTVALGFNAGHLSVTPFQTYRYGRKTKIANDGPIFALRLSPDLPRHDRDAVTMVALELVSSILPQRHASLIVGVACVGDSSADMEQITNKLVELKGFFEHAQAREGLAPA